MFKPVSHKTHTINPKDPEHDSKRSGHWPSVRRHFIAQHSVCQACGRGKPLKLNVHHQIPFHYVTALNRPELEVEVSNLITLCVDHDDQHHLLIGHLDSFKSYNADVLTDVKKYWNMNRSQIMNDREYRVKQKNRPPPVDKMTPKQKDNLKKYLDKRFPDTGVHAYTRLAKRKRDELHLQGHFQHVL
jgi:hypothetical protein